MPASLLIVGAGPVGLTMALALKHRGVDVRIIDKAPARSTQSKALVLWPRTLELLDVLGCASPFVDAGKRVIGARVMADHKLLVHVSLETARSAWPYALMLPQSDTERLLEEALAQLGVHVERQVELTSFLDDAQADAVTGILRHAGGKEEPVRTPWLLACDGAHSTVRHGLASATFDGDTLPSDWLLADVELDGDVPRDEITICWTKHGVLAIFPIAGQRARVIADIGSTPLEAASQATMEDVQALLDARGPAGLLAHDPVWLSRFRINERKVRDYAYGRVFLAGDAAHVHSPAGGQGMNTGMQDAFNLAWKLALVWHGRAQAALLESYSPERSAIGVQVLRNAGAMTRVAMLANPILQQIRDVAAGALGHIPALRQRFVDQLTELDLHYGDGPLVQTPSGSARRPCAGERAPDVALNPHDSVFGGGAFRLHEALGTGRFAVMSVGTEAIALQPHQQAIAVAVEMQGREGFAADYEEGHIYLVRPDAYVMLSVRPDDVAPLLSALDTLAGA